jgi:hypothetical protein
MDWWISGLMWEFADGPFVHLSINPPSAFFPA